MKNFAFIIAFLCIGQSTVLAQTQTTGFSFSALNGCTQVTKKATNNTSGRFIWKHKAAHFNTAVIVTPRRYTCPNYTPISVDIYSPITGRRLLGTRLKSRSHCTGAGEDLFATTFITPNGYTGKRINRRYGPIIVRLKPILQGASEGCRFYYVPRPTRRSLYANV